MAKIVIPRLRADLTETQERRLREYYPDDELELPEIGPRNGPQATEMAKELGANIVVLHSPEPIPVHGLKNGVRYIFFNDSGDIEEVESVVVNPKPFVP